MKVPQIGRVIIQDDVEIGAGSTVDRGANRDTIIGEGAKIDNLVQIGHNVVIGRHCVLVAQSGVSGSCIVEDFAALGGQAGLAGHLHVGVGRANRRARRSHARRARRRALGRRAGEAGPRVLPRSLGGGKARQGRARGFIISRAQPSGRCPRPLGRKALAHHQPAQRTDTSQRRKPEAAQGVDRREIRGERSIEAVDRDHALGDVQRARAARRLRASAPTRYPLLFFVRPRLSSRGLRRRAGRGSGPARQSADRHVRRRRSAPLASPSAAPRADASSETARGRPRWSSEPTMPRDWRSISRVSLSSSSALRLSASASDIIQTRLERCAASGVDGSGTSVNGPSRV